MSYSGLGVVAPLIPGVTVPPPVLMPGVAAAVARVACQPPDVWNDLTQQCIQKIGPIITQDMPSICAQVDATWDPATNACKPNELPPSTGWSTMTWLLIGAGVLGVAIFIGRKKYTRNSGRTDFDRLKACKTELMACKAR